MTPRGWFAFLDSQSGKDIPTAARFFFAALTGAGLSLSFIGLNLQIYSWVSIGLLLMLVMTPKAGPIIRTSGDSSPGWLVPTSSTAVWCARSSFNSVSGTPM